jgi:hypothetical protein
VLTNGTRIGEDVADALAKLASRTPYSLEIRVSLDDVDPESNDQVRGHGAWEKAVVAIRRLDARGLLPIVTVTEILMGGDGSTGTYRRFRDFLLSLGIEKPRVKIIPVFSTGRLADTAGERLTEARLEGFNRGLLQCAESRVVAHGGVYACPILAGLPGALLSMRGLGGSLQPAPLYHPACVTCHESGMSCRNY